MKHWNKLQNVNFVLKVLSNISPVICGILFLAEVFGIVDGWEAATVDIIFWSMIVCFLIACGCFLARLIIYLVAKRKNIRL